MKNPNKNLWKKTQGFPPCTRASVARLTAIPPALKGARGEAAAPPWHPSVLAPSPSRVKINGLCPPLTSFRLSRYHWRMSRGKVSYNRTPRRRRATLDIAHSPKHSPCKGAVKDCFPLPNGECPRSGNGSRDKSLVRGWGGRQPPTLGERRTWHSLTDSKL